MKFDSIVIGGGMAGLSAALRLAEAGQKTLLMASGQSALHFSSGSVDLLESDGDPRAALPAFMAAHPDHPYSKVGMQNIEGSLADLQRHCAEEGLPLMRQEHNHQRLTPIGTLKSTWLSPDTCACMTDAPAPDAILLATLEGFRDFHPALAAANLATHARFAHSRILTGEIRLPQLAQFSRNPHEFRSADIARLFDKQGPGQQDLLADLAREISRMVQGCGVPGCRHIVLPACLSLGLVGPRLSELERRTGCTIKEVATMPPSLIGMRMQEALKRRVMTLGGTFLTSERVLGARYDGDKVIGVHSQHGEDQLFEADHFVLASGSFFSRGLESRLGGIREPIFDADVLSLAERDAWAGRRLFDHHPFMGFGVKTDERLRVLRGGRPLTNLYGAGSVLAHYDPIKEGSGSGVAVATGWQAAGHILAEG
ncbi:glycerol-3-phosphate dehydrogenase subunit GlpB [Aeromonas caviae]|uniref:Glycerol-3-phosphate dehydrogenase subunit GlpB n=1 Tax=Aeromonas caviae TaxID=648 RepID=A0AA43AJH2_AERCA|nr:MULTISPECIES: glycerol-3-phosphate dehydrogenase subunit GlpB [Aeromonas]MCR3930973.1 glycerol-3-phosphate dehydrogenase subunit GlpB [Aeromonas caviae]MDH1898339.1 glycerol-3-phosphate dehydrogenase subunit GlpB [Aeromonas caviae]MDX7735747.1 glycerol-3-phosphate dehydrogenase subunit GlpB [Aeromonas caviae]MDY7841700.1 glycerol-3-phosphate dehydrogenase subunit GlpB [Aeromonas caviae]UJQ38758.1 glycerol-3-phosphate dehydrogenase subunit GlpB [Aeromonas caviae]